MNARRRFSVHKFAPYGAVAKPLGSADVEVLS